MATKGQSLDSNVEEWPKEAETEIYDTCFYNNTEKFTNILKIKGQEIDVNKIDQNGSLFIAIDYENVTIVRELLKLGSDPNAKYSIRDPPLFNAFWNQNMCIVKLLLQYGASIENTLLVAIQKGLTGIVEKILEFGVNIDGVENKAGTSPLHIATDINSTKIVKLLLKHNADINYKDLSGETPLHLAIIQEKVDLIKELLKSGADPDGKNVYRMTPLWRALKRNKMNIAEILLENGADINFPFGSRGETVLHHAAAKGKLEIVEFLLKHGANINAVTSKNGTPLFFAAIECGPFHAKIVKTLLINGANTNIKDNDELVTPFYCATFKTAKIFFDFAIDLDLNVRDTDTNTPFEYFIKNRIEDEALGISKMIIHHLSC